MPETAIIIPAAGASTRMGTAKQLLAFRGRPLPRHAVEVARSAGCGPVLVVLGAREQELRSVIAGHGFVHPHPRRGSGRTARRWSDPCLSGPTLRHRGVPSGIGNPAPVTGKTIVASQYSGTAGVPAFFARSAFPKLLVLKPDQGCKGIIVSNLSDALLVDCPEASIDLDTPEDFARHQTC